ncbi:hypothetical protein TEA_005526 [Camellia sinensis var. sinensis]|uniref:Alpha-glucan water dikinase-like N-terminal Ig-like domain-containing protein n=1 Tax=Camellia sinensis var. sinensis TaxID=542762 RepID=A0A4S4D770_CAMSN|nr:hypothetical protein TEA_005526 [Camellia sinensis var. sinensis]
MSTFALEPLGYHCRREHPNFRPNYKKSKAFSLNYTPRPRRRPRPLSHGSIFCNFRPPLSLPLRATSTNTALVEETFESEEVLFKETFPLKRTQKGEGKISIRLDNGKDQENWQLTVGCNLPGKWVLHWGVNYVNDFGSEWDQPPVEMRPPDSILIKDYAIETPLKKSSAVVEGDLYYEVKINFSTNRDIAAINFVLKDEETGAWYQHKGRDFKVVLIDNLHEDGNFVGAKKGLGIWPGALGQLSSVLLKSEGAHPKGEDSSESRYPNQKNKSLEGFYEEHSIVREVLISNSVTVSVRKCPEMAKNLLYMETDLPGDVVVHWGVCKDDGKKWEIPAEPYPAALLHKDPIVEDDEDFQVKVKNDALFMLCTKFCDLDEECVTSCEVDKALVAVVRVEEERKLSFVRAQKALNEAELATSSLRRKKAILEARLASEEEGQGEEDQASRALI